MLLRHKLTRFGGRLGLFRVLEHEWTMEIHRTFKSIFRKGDQHPSLSALRSICDQFDAEYGAIASSLVQQEH